MTEVPLVPDITKPFPRITDPDGLLSWLSTVYHKQIGIMYLAVTLLFFLVGDVEALFMRIQLAQPNNTFLGPELYNQVFTMHGTTMIFLVLVPMLIGFATYFVPLMIGARDMAFPRLNALSFWVFFFGGLLLYYSFLAGGAPLGSSDRHDFHVARARHDAAAGATLRLDGAGQLFHHPIRAAATQRSAGDAADRPAA